MSALVSTITWRLQKVGLEIRDYQIRWAIKQKKIAVVPRKNEAGHFLYTDADFKVIEAYFRAKEAKKQ